MSLKTTGMVPLFLVSMATVGFEIALTRYFAVAKWSEYGYWVISLVLAGFAFSGVAMAIARDWFARHGRLLLHWLPVALIVAAALGYRFVTTNPFNPLQLQNQATLAPQLVNIANYYVALLPFFFLSGLYISLSFVLNYHAVGRVYGFDLTGAGAGSLLALGLMQVVHPFLLLPCLLLPLGLAVLAQPRLPAVMATVLALCGGEYLLLADNQADFNDYKAIYAPLHVPDSKVAATLYSPRGLYMLLDDFTERVDTDISNNAGLLGVGNPPASFGLYRDGNRLAALPKPGPLTADYAKATLAALPYTLRPKPSVLLAGTSGGFRIAEARALGAAEIVALEQEPVLLEALRQGFGPSPALAAPPVMLADSPIAVARGEAGRYDVIDFAGDFLDTAEANTNAFAAEAIGLYLRALKPGGIVSLPVSIREFPAYAIRMLATVRAALLAGGVADPGRHVIVIRSAWNVRVLVSNQAFPAADIAASQAFGETRSFDLSWFPGINVEAARANIFNDLPAVSFTSGSVTSGEGAHDAIADEAGPMLAGQGTESGRDFDLSPVTFDRPAFYAVLRLAQLGVLLQRLELLPQQEIGPLVNLAVLAQAAVVAAVVLIVPLFGRAQLRGGARAGRGAILRAIVYFSALGLGFLFLEIFLIERATFYLNDRTAAFSLVLTGMLIFSGIGSMFEARFERSAHWALRGAILIVLVWGVILVVGLQEFMLATLSLPWLARAAIVLALVAPASMALGLPFPLGLSRMGNSSFLPWAWALNGAFSVVSTPLANLMALQLGYDMVLATAMMLYAACVFAFPQTKET